MVDLRCINLVESSHLRRDRGAFYDVPDGVTSMARRAIRRAA
jgi:hypothetical protein